MKNVGLGLAALAGAAMSACAAHAQVASDQMVGQRPQRSMAFDAMMNVEYDSNVTRASPELAAREGLHLEDVLYAPTLNANLVLPVARQAVFLTGYLGYIGHQHNTVLDHARADVRGGVGNVLGPCGSVLTGRYFRGRSELQNNTLTTTVQDLQEITEIGAGVTCVRRPSLSVTINASRQWATNSAVQSTNGNYTTTEVDATISFQRPSLGGIGLIGSYSTTDYSQDGLAPEIAALGRGGYEATSVGLNLQRRLGGRIEANASVSYSHASMQHPQFPTATTGASTGFSGIVYSGDISYRMSSRLRLHAGFERAVRPSLVPGGSFELDTDYDASVTYNLGSHVQLRLEGRDREINVHGDIPVSATTLTDARTKEIDASVRYNFSRRLSVLLTGRYETRGANNPLFEYDNDVAGLTFEAKF